MPNLPTISAQNEIVERDSLDDALTHLENNSKFLNRVGLGIFVGSVGLACYLFWDVKSTTEGHIQHFIDSPSNYSLLAYMIVRSAALSAIAATILVFTVKTAVACFDQAARFSKRRYGALFLKYLYSKYDEKSMGDVKNAKHIIKFFEAWNRTIESAFSTVKIEKDKGGSTEITLSKDGATYKKDEREK